MNTNATMADPGFFLGGGALVSCSTSTPINHIVVVFFFCRIPVVLENRRLSQGGGAHPLHPPPRSVPDVRTFGLILSRSENDPEMAHH